MTQPPRKWAVIGTSATSPMVPPGSAVMLVRACSRVANRRIASCPNGIQVGLGTPWPCREVRAKPLPSRRGRGGGGEAARARGGRGGEVRGVAGARHPQADARAPPPAPPQARAAPLAGPPPGRADPPPPRGGPPAAVDQQRPEQAHRVGP